MKIIFFSNALTKIFKLNLLFILFFLKAAAQQEGYCAICSREAWAGDSVALNKFISGCGVIDTISYDSLHNQVKSNGEYQTITMKLNSGKVMFKDSIYFFADKMPEFKGGDVGLFQYLSKNIHYPAGEKNVEGTVYISFIVEKDGSVKHTRIIRSIGERFDKEALQVINNMPKWQPGSKKGNAVRVQMNIPVRFALH
jgi:protein TonB